MTTILPPLPPPAPALVPPALVPPPPTATATNNGNNTASSATATTPAPNAWWEIGVIIIVMVMLIAWAFQNASSTRKVADLAKAEAKAKAEVAEQARKLAIAQKAATNHTVIAPAQRPWSMRTLEIPADGLAVHLYPGWRAYSLSENIAITLPDGRVIRDQPGVSSDRHLGMQPEGTYIFLADPPGSPRKVSIYNRW